ncbi:MAG: DUF2304 domain-containing protein [Candidatus Pacebacteria bacterium]|nr:DUF2304 domain-containing protein [Candidatus Paceibacterota bacterium]
MWQQIIALIVILFFLTRLFSQKNKKNISQAEFALWLVFWALAAVAIIFLKQIDAFLYELGFSGGGINFLLYLAVMILFFLIFRLRLKYQQLNQKLTEVVRKITLETANKEDRQK